MVILREFPYKECIVSVGNIMNPVFLVLKDMILLVKQQNIPFFFLEVFEVSHSPTVGSC